MGSEVVLVVNVRSHTSSFCLSLSLSLSLADDPSSQSTQLLEKKKEMAEVQVELDQKREEFRERMQKCAVCFTI